MGSLLQLAFAIQNQPGVYALLLGSGISRAAGIPTGWEVTVELATQLAMATTETKPTDIPAWYETTYGRPLNYSDVVAQRAATPAERRKLLEPFFEPSEAEQEQGTKTPTMAQLVAAGFIRVIITTNFDRLLERALEEFGIVPDVIHTLDALNGASPLVHSRCTIIKLHGDYKDARIKNIEAELNRYQPKWNKLLDRVLDEYGLIVCGWSAEWDFALRDAVMRAPNRRYSTYWASRGAPSVHAQDLIKARAAQLIGINDADQFFETLQSKVSAIADIKHAHPDSVAVAVAEVKRLVTEEKHHVRLHDLVMEEGRRTIAGCQSIKTNDQDPKSWVGDYTRQVHARMTLLLAMLAHGVNWGNPGHHRTWVAVLDRLVNDPSKIGVSGVTQSRMDRLAAVLGLYALGIAATHRQDFDLLRKMLCIKLRQMGDTGMKPRVIDSLHSGLFDDYNLHPNLKWLDGMEKRQFPFSDWLNSTFQPIYEEMFSDSDAHQLAFDRFELTAALAYRTHADTSNDSRFWLPGGGYRYRYTNRQMIYAEIKASLEQDGDQSVYIQSQLLGTSAANVQA